MDTPNRSDSEYDEDSDSDILAVPEPLVVTPRRERNESPEPPAVQRNNLASNGPQNRNVVRNLYEVSGFQNLRYTESLYNCAREKYNGPMLSCDYVHRAVKDNELAELGQRPGIKEPCPMNNHGHLQCPANGKLSGVFLSAKTYSDGLPISSPFGGTLLLVKHEDLFDPQTDGLYLADYYCYKEDGAHYLTLVVCPAEQEINRFCRENLYELPWTNNGLFECDGQRLLQVDSPNLYIEVFFCGSVSLDMVHSRRRVTDTSANYRPPRSANRDCPCCNPRF